MRCTVVLFRHAASGPDALQYLKKIRPQRTYDRRLTHIHSDKLCDDVLALLKPTLPLPHTCDIIDLHPGPCVWTRKLHDIVKPRRHILFEPRRESFADFIDPLLSEPDSTYRYVKDLKTAFDEKKQLLSEDVYNFRKTLDESGVKKYAVNKSLIITANLSGMSRKVKGFHGSEAKLFLNDFYRSIFVQEDFTHRYGLIRMFAWVGEDARKSIIPTGVILRTKQSIQLESTCRVHQVTGPSPFHGMKPFQQRSYEIDMENQQDIQKSQKQLKLPIPKERTLPLPTRPFLAMQPTMEEVRKHQDLYPHNQVFIRKAIALDDYLSTNRPEWYAKYLHECAIRFKDVRKWCSRTPAEPIEREYRTLMIQLRTHHNTYLKARDFIWEYRQLFKKIRDAATKGWFSPQTGMPVEGENKKAAEELLKEDSIFEQRRNEIKTDTRTRITKGIDDYRCYDSNRKVMAWNERVHDPLFVDGDEFFPNNPLTLIEFTPKPETPTRLNTVDKQICFDYVCTLLMTHPMETILQGIKRLVPAGYDQFLNRVPELRDPARGGWWDPNLFRIRALHHDHFIAIALAFHDWPHRPSIEKLMAVQKTMFEDGPF